MKTSIHLFFLAFGLLTPLQTFANAECKLHVRFDQPAWELGAIMPGTTPFVCREAAKIWGRNNLPEGMVGTMEFTNGGKLVEACRMRVVDREIELDCENLAF